MVPVRTQLVDLPFQDDLVRRPVNLVSSHLVVVDSTQDVQTQGKDVQSWAKIPKDTPRCEDMYAKILEVKGCLLVEGRKEVRLPQQGRIGLSTQEEREGDKAAALRGHCAHLLSLAVA